MLALVALLFQAVVPTYAMAAAQPDSETLVPICTSSGIIYVSLDEDGEPLPPDPPAQKPCHFCLSKAAPLAIPQVIGMADCGTASELAAPPLDAELAVAKARIGPQPIRAPPHIL